MLQTVASDPRKKPPMAAGQRYGRLTVVAFVEVRNGRSYWLFRCGCDNKIITRDAHSVRQDRTKSCGCLNQETRAALFARVLAERKQKTRVEVAGHRYGRLVAMEFVEHRHGHSLWRFKCDCEIGKTVVASLSNVRSRNTLSCGCLRRERPILDTVYKQAAQRRLIMAMQSRTVTLKIGIEQLERARMLADRSDVTVTSMLRELIALGLDRKETHDD